MTRTLPRAATPAPPFAQGGDVTETVIVWIFGGGVLLTLLGLSVLRFVPAHERLVVFRFGRAAAVRGPGLVAVLPGVHRAVRTPHGPVRIDLFWLETTTRDGLPVTVSATALRTVRDPARYAGSSAPDPASEDTAAEVLRDHVATRTLPDLARLDADTLHELSAEITDRLADRGVELSHLELHRMEVPLGAELIRWATRVPAAYRNGGCSTMDISRTTVPGTGTLHHCVTRGGQHFAVLVDNADRRRLLVYGSVDLDVPSQTILMDHDEADQIADILHSRSVADRLSALERRLGRVSGETR